MKPNLNEIHSGVGNIIKANRKLNGISFNQLAKKAGISKGSLSKIENGLGNPTMETLVKIFFVMNMRVAFLMQPKKKK